MIKIFDVYKLTEMSISVTDSLEDRAKKIVSFNMIMDCGLDRSRFREQGKSLQVG